MKADKTKIERLLKTARGQIDGVLKMIEEDKYCIDIANQILASQAVLKKASQEILKAHMESCVAEAFDAGDAEAKKKKVEELVAVMGKLAK